MTKILLMATTIGDSNAIYQIAQEFNKDEGNNVTIVALGKLAADKLQSLKLLDRPITVINAPELKEFSHMALNGNFPTDLKDEQLDSLYQILGDFDAVLAGTPSPNASDGSISRVGFQLMSRYTHALTGVYNDYLFYEPSHPFWPVANKEKLDHIFMYSDSSFQDVPAIGKKVTALYTHPALEQARIRAMQVSPTAISEYRAKLEIAVEQTLIFVPGGKAGDEELINSIGAALKQIEPKAHMQVRIGLHPAASPQYRQILTNCIEELGMSENIALISAGALQSNDQALLAAEAVIGQESTMVAEGYAIGKPSVYVSNKNFYAAPVVSANKLVTFFRDIQHKGHESKKPIDVNPGMQIESAAVKIVKKFKR